MTINASWGRGLVFAIALTSAGATYAQQAIDVYKTASCGCCAAWAKILRMEGFQVQETNLGMADLMARKTAAGLKDGQTSCHTGFIDGYVIEGHVPVREIRRLLSERPDIAGLTVPDMPYGSPGMGDQTDAEPYEVLMVRRDGTSDTYATYP